LNGYIGKHEETVKVLEYYYTHQDFLTDQDIEHIQISLADAYIDIHKYEEALKLIQKGIKQTSKNNEELQYNRYLILLGRYNVKIKQYSKAIENLEKCKKYFLKNNLDFDANYTMLYLGQSYAEIQNKEKAIENFIKIDSIIQTSNNTFPELRYIYTYIIDYYKENNDKEKQLYYINQFLKIDEILDSQFKYISRELPRKYDTPKLLTEKEKIISILKKRRYLSYITIGMLCSMVIILTFLFVKAKRKEKEYKKNAQKLIKEINDKIYPYEKSSEAEITSDQVVFDSEKNKLSDDTVKNILQGLKIFEDKKQYLKNGITLNSLAKKLKTNSTYLSQIVNTYKEKTFATYLSDLRIDYALIRLVNDKKFRSYKLSVIAEELGYNNEQAFAKAFKRKTGTTFSIYIKEIEGKST
jgi:AraC-like DNA-binding protein